MQCFEERCGGSFEGGFEGTFAAFVGLVTFDFVGVFTTFVSSGGKYSE